MRRSRGPVFTKRPRGGARRWLRPALLLILLFGLAWAAGLIWFVDHLPDADIAAAGDPLSGLAHTEAAVVLTGGGGRLQTGLDLLSDGHADKLFVSGVYRGTELEELLHHVQRVPDDLDCCLELGYAAANTRGNAAETAAWMRRERLRSLRLVTAHYHLPRSLLEFRMALPETRIETLAVAPPDMPQPSLWPPGWRTVLLASEYSKYLLTAARYALTAGSLPDGLLAGGAAR